MADDFGESRAVIARALGVSVATVANDLAGG